MRIFIVILTSIFLSSCSAEKNLNSDKNTTDSAKTLKKEIDSALNNWHKAAAEANFEDYFNLMTKDGVFIGTDATENWQNQAFKKFSKPYFDKGKAWSFTPINRNIYIYKDQKIAWFDELLDTQMKICRGSGIMKLEDNQWKVAHYVLSIAIPNEKTSEVIKIKATSDSLLTKQLMQK